MIDISYFTILKEAQASFEERKSQFIGHVKRVENEEEAKSFISEIKSVHKEATHNVYAYVIGENMGIQRYSDDGEPQGTAGIPVLEVIKKNGITDTVIVVTRYFGGILLGTGGLIRAYSHAASMAVSEGRKVQKVEGIKLQIQIDYELLGKVQYMLNQKEWNIEAIDYTDKVLITLFCELDVLDKIIAEVINLTSNKCSFIKGKTELFFKQENKLVQSSY